MDHVNQILWKIGRINLISHNLESEAEQEIGWDCSVDIVCLERHDNLCWDFLVLV